MLQLMKNYRLLVKKNLKNTKDADLKEIYYLNKILKYGRGLIRIQQSKKIRLIKASSKS